jgi:hypothetical protein
LSDIRIEMRAERARKTFSKLASRLKDMKPIFKTFKIFYQDDMMKRVWESRGSAMEGGQWANYSDAYRKWKAKHYAGKPKMILTGKLYNAVQGGAGWYDKISKDSMTMEVKGEAYFYWVQHRQKNPRYYFYTPKEDLPNRAWAYLIKIADEYLEEADK